MRVEFPETVATAAGQRRSDRLESPVKQIVLTGDGGDKWVGRVTDESIGGIGLQFDQVVPLAEGQELELVLDGVRMLSQIRHFSATQGQGCRVGVEWNAHCLSERARAARKSSDGECLDEATRQFLDLIPSGVYMLWRNFESYDWRKMVITAERLASSAADCGLSELEPLAEGLRTNVERSADEAIIRGMVYDFVRECVRFTRST